MRILSTPRPTGSAAERAALDALCAWLDLRGIAYTRQPFRLYPYFAEGVGSWLIISRTLLAAALLARRGTATAGLALAGLAGGPLDVAGVPLVSWMGARRGNNLLLAFGPQDAERTLILAAHYDSKTELLDHQQRAIFLRRLPLGLAATAALGLLGPLDAHLARAGSRWARLTRPLALALALALLPLAWGLGLNLALGRLAKPSSGAVDNGAACALLLALAEKLYTTAPQHSRVVLALFGGEEANMQGSRAFVKTLAPARLRGSRSLAQRESGLAGEGNRPTHVPLVINLELMGQDGGYVYWQHDGTALRRVPTDAAANRLIAMAVTEVTGSAPQPAGLINSDASSFLCAGLPAGVLGSTDRVLGIGGLHRPSDHPRRVVPERLAEGLAILERLVALFDEGRR